MIKHFFFCGNPTLLGIFFTEVEICTIESKIRFVMNCMMDKSDKSNRAMIKKCISLADRAIRSNKVSSKDLYNFSHELINSGCSVNLSKCASRLFDAITIHKGGDSSLCYIALCQSLECMATIGYLSRDVYEARINHYISLAKSLFSTTDFISDDQTRSFLSGEIEKASISALFDYLNDYEENIVLLNDYGKYRLNFTMDYIKPMDSMEELIKYVNDSRVLINYLRRLYL